MEKVICMKCGSVGYTAAPMFVKCSDCGGRHKIVKNKAKYYKQTLKERRWLG